MITSPRFTLYFVLGLLTNFISLPAKSSTEPTFEQRIDFRLNKMPERLKALGKSAVFVPSPEFSKNPISSKKIPNRTLLLSISKKKDNIVIGAFKGDTQFINYKYTAAPTTPLYAYSVTKFIVGFLVAEEICNGNITPSDKAGDLSERLKATAYQDVKLLSILGMYSGVHIDADDFVSEGVTKNHRSYHEIVYQGASMYEQLKTKASPDEGPDIHWQYSNFDSNALAVILNDSTGRSLAQLFQERIWDHISPEHFGYWETDINGEVMGGYGLALTAADWLRVGRYIALQIGNSACLKDHYLGEGYDVYKNRYAVWSNHSWANPDNRSQFGGVGHDGQILSVDIDNGNVVFIFSNRDDGYDEHISKITWNLLSEASTDDLSP